jgi:drug/metabolite transporter (DMT)-like permease
MPAKSSLSIYVRLILTVAFWGGSSVAVKFVVVDISPILGAFFRFFIASICLVLYVLYQMGRKVSIPVRDLPFFFFLGLLGISAFNLFFFNGLKLTTAINAGFINAFSPVLINMLSSIILHDRIKVGQIFGFVVSLFGVLVIISRGSVHTLANIRFNYGDLFILLAVVSWAIYSVLITFVTGKYGTILSTTYACVIGDIILLLAALPYFGAFSFSLLTYKIIIAMLFLGVMASALSFVWWTQGIETIGAGNTAVFQNLTPIFSAVFSVMILGEKFHVYHLLGGMLVISGILVNNFIYTKKIKLKPLQSELPQQ